MEASIDASLAAAFDRSADFLPDTLMSRASLDRTRRVAELFPAAAVTFFGFEARLAAGRAAATDCAMNLSPAGAAMLARGAIGGAGAAWDRVARFCRIWGETRDDRFADASAIWLEFDAAGDGAPTPNLLFGYWPGDPATCRPWTWMRDTVFPALLGDVFGEPLRAALDRCIGALPDGVGDLQIGVMLARPLAAVRLCVFDLPPSAVPAYLDAVGWRGDRAALMRLVAAFAPHCDFVGLHLDVAGHVLPHVGIEPNFRAGCWSRQPHREPRWEGLWRVLANEGLLDRAKHAALLGWTGHRHETLDAPVLLMRGLSHVKVVLGADGAALAKAYFGIALRDAGDAR